MKQRITSFDTFRAIAAFLIVLLHYPLKVSWEEEILVMTRIAVPFFFLTSGYFHYSNELQMNKIKKELKKIVGLILLVNLVYLILRIVIKGYYCHLAGRSILHAIRKILLQLTRKRFLFFNFGLAGHLWYLRAMIFVIIIFILVKKWKLEEIVKWSIPILLLLDLCFGKYSQAVFGEPFPRKYVEPLSKFLGVGYVYFFLGYFLRQAGQKKWYAAVRQFLAKNPVIVMVGIFVIGCFNVLEFHWLDAAGMDVNPYNYLGTFLLVMWIFIYLDSNQTWGSKTRLYQIGAKYSMYVYFYHIFVAKLISFLFQGTKIYRGYYMFRPFVLYAIVIGGTMVGFWLKKTMKKVSKV